MLLLAVDTSGRNGSIALARVSDSASGAAPDVLEVVPLAGGAFSAQLVPQIAALLGSNGFTKHDMAAFIVVTGPGSFTGLRIGLAAIKGLAEILDKPITAISLLEILALRSGFQGRVISVLDAGRGEVYVGEYEVEKVSAEKSARLMRESLLTRDEFLALARESDLVTSDESVIAIVRNANLAITAVEPINAGMLVEPGWRKIQAGDTVFADQMDANYIRRTDAEILKSRL
jgi:tRNA threonylcarbamoyladenosine biosynthesis protein TsaB